MLANFTSLQKMSFNFGAQTPDRMRIGPHREHYFFLSTGKGIGPPRISYLLHHTRSAPYFPIAAPCVFSMAMRIIIVVKAKWRKRGKKKKLRADDELRHGARWDRRQAKERVMAGQ